MMIAIWLKSGLRKPRCPRKKMKRRKRKRKMRKRKRRRRVRLQVGLNLKKWTLRKNFRSRSQRKKSTLR